QGDDEYIVENAGDVVVELDGQGNDTIVAKGVSVSVANTSVETVDGSLSGFVDLDITGNASANFLRGSDGNNVLDGGAGDDTIDGDAGNDRATYTGNRASYTVTKSGGSVTVTGADGTDVLIGVDSIGFADQVLVLDAHLATGTVALSGDAKEA